MNSLVLKMEEDPRESDTEISIVANPDKTKYVLFKGKRKKN